MIRLKKGTKPEVLVTDGAHWTDEYLEALAAGGDMPDSIRYRYRHSDIKHALRQEASEKCVYCETKLPVGETDHVCPVTACPELIVEWLNLALACKECNTNKSGYHAPLEPLINPFVDNPDAHLLVFGPLIMHRAGDLKGRRTVLKLKLQRRNLLERRAERVVRLQALVTEFIAQPNGTTKELLAEALRSEAADEAEYAAVVRAYLYQELGWQLPAPNPDPEIQAA